jgi:hypothetical protein
VASLGDDAVDADLPDAAVGDVRATDAGPDVSQLDASRLDAPADDSVPDVSSPPDSGCIALAQPGSCSPTPYSCMPPGMVPGYNRAAACNQPCGANNFGCEVTLVDASESVTIECLCGGGRFPEGLALLRRGRDAERDPLGAVLARNAALEGAAVRAFEQLARELAAHHAPRELVARARKAARQEVTHARLLRRAAEARGCAAPAARERAAPAAPRSLRDIARENAVEGCGREALGAALLALQSRRCPDRELRAVLARIARDEMSHAQLSWDLHLWLLSRLDPGERMEVLAAHEAFLDRCEAGAPPELADERVAEALGMPTREQWRTLVRAVRWGLRSVSAALRAA